MRIYYFNDESIPVVVQVNGQLRPSLIDKHSEPTIEYFTLQPTEGKAFDIDAPEGAIPYIKKWNRQNQVLLTYVPADSDLLIHHDEQDV